MDEIIKNTLIDNHKTRDYFFIASSSALFMAA